MQENESTLKNLMEILTKYHGDYTVCFYFTTNNKKIKTQQQYWIDGSTEAIDSIKKLMGDDAVRIG